MITTKSEFVAKYGHMKVSFSYYYKFNFTYTAPLDNGMHLSVTIGGDSDAIYRREISSNDVITVADLDPYCGGVFDGSAVVESFYDY